MARQEMSRGAPAGTAEDAAKAGKALEATGVAVRTAGPDDSVGGVTPGWVALPETATEVAAVLRACADQDLAVVPAGGGTKLHWGPPPERCDVLVDTCCLNQIVEHEAGDLVVRVQAGVTLEALAEALAAEGQELALDPPLPGGTVGGLLATAVAGPRRFRYGTARDLLIGITVVLADGTVAKSGGKVVKNVAGYDLGKLFTGSYGTLGVVVDATFRLHPLPAARAWVVAGFGGAADRVEAVTAAVDAAARSRAEPSAIELDWPDVAGPITVAVLLEGAEARDRAGAVRGLMGPTARILTEPPAWWGRPPGTHDGPRDGHPGGEILMEMRTPPARLPRALAGVAEAARDAGVRPAVRGSAASAVLYVALPGETGAEEAAAFAGALRADLEDAGSGDAGRLIVLAAPEEAGRRVDRWGHVGALTLMRRVKERFDPGRRMSPGRFVGGI
ncbi:FAD-binding oxidoreductase [Microbispora sp. NPDC049125]|uniref:FAD-binding oxidoreductase n=1 Tax=Microbispora sp. NPDC049125 TaxID=3154929 RepID=UPI00346565DC